MTQPKLKKYQKPRRRPFRWQPLLLAVGGLALVVAAFFALQNKPDPGAEIEVSGAPSLKVDQELIDLGDIKVDQPAQATFTLSNTGDQPLKLAQEPYIEVVEGC
ncbi:MAG TPA: hypothetical protein VN363_03975 [Anaerolineales bacterium]|nr:hypothetical protein [Anaerolineales bacterium]